MIVLFGEFFVGSTLDFQFVLFVINRRSAGEPWQINEKFFFWESSKSSATCNFSAFLLYDGRWRYTTWSPMGSKPAVGARKKNAIASPNKVCPTRGKKGKKTVDGRLGEKKLPNLPHLSTASDARLPINAALSPRTISLSSASCTQTWTSCSVYQDHR